MYAQLAVVADEGNIERHFLSSPGVFDAVHYQTVSHQLRGNLGLKMTGNSQNVYF